MVASLRARTQSPPVAQTVLPNHFLRRVVGVPVSADAAPQDILAAAGQTEKTRHLREFTQRDLRADTRVLYETTWRAPFGAEVGAALKDTAINTLFLGKQVRKALSVYTFRNVYFAHDRNRFAIFTPTEVDALSTALPTREGLAQMQNAERLDRLCYCGDMYSPDNPAHYISEHLSRAVIFRDQLGEAADTITLAESHAPLCNEFRTRVDGRFRILPAWKVVFVKELVLLSSSTFGNPNGHPCWFLDPDVMTVFRGCLPEPSKDPVKGVYLSRRDASRRVLQNEAALESRLSDMGIRPQIMSNMDGKAQIQCLRNSQCIVAPHGGALLNILSARPGARVVELLNPDRATLGFAALALSLGLDYRFVVGKPDPSGTGDKPWVVDIDEVCRLAGD